MDTFKYLIMDHDAHGFKLNNTLRFQLSIHYYLVYIESSVSHAIKKADASFAQYPATMIFSLSVLGKSIQPQTNADRSADF